ncbi:MAG: spore cortex biosynthesis protein YabQ, partial [Eubacterium sp.]|nr:spore cortex biosynthesis protein YabQ [Eubacterium sp.]
MILPMKEQGLLFLFICFSGFCFGFVYDVLRLCRRCFHCGCLFGLVSDLVFWLCAFAAVFWFLLGVNYGEVRIYMVLGLIGGMVVNYNSLSGLFIYYSEKALKA